MIEATVGDLLDDKLADIVRKHRGESPREGAPIEDIKAWVQSAPKIYAVRDGDVVFYIGQSQEPDMRLREHLGQPGKRGPTRPSSLGYVILNNLPEARAWTIELWTVQECKEELADETTMNWRWDKDLAERCMIKARRPFLNSTHNGGGRMLPARYRDPEEAAKRCPPPVFSIDLSGLYQQERLV